jgi:hypothetical protein
MEAGRTQRFVDRWGWLCPFVMMLAAAGVLVAFGFSLWSGLLAGLLLVCPALVVWGAVKLRRHPL